jgi:hypothetical protein
MKQLLITVLVIVAIGSALLWYNHDPVVNFNADIRPVLNSKCVKCHGGVKRAADLSLLFRADALQPNKSGKAAIVPGDAKASELIARIKSHDPDERMPKHAEPLSQEQIERLEAWIEQGANWEQHWAYVKPRAGQPPDGDSEWPRNDIDRFILARLQHEKLHPAPEAGKTTLARRVSLDLVGLPPTPQQVDTFIADTSEQAYESLVDRLLDSQKYGEKWAGMWLDLARYADTRGYEADRERQIWRYRDWLIDAFNRDLPFDRFTIEQLAGDLLPHPSPEQYLATAFHRNTMNNDEGGTDNEEFRVAAVVDRVNTTWEIWQSTSFGCVQCHGHPYDPFRHEDYYKFLAFFNNTRDEDVPTESPNLKSYPDSLQSDVTSVLDWIEQHAPGAIQSEQTARDYYWKLLHITEPKLHPHHFELLAKGARGQWLSLYAGGLACVKGINLTGKDKLLIAFNSAADGGHFEIRLDRPDGKRLIDIPLSKKNKGLFAYDLPKTEGRHALYLAFENPALDSVTTTSSIRWFVFYKELPGRSEPGFESVQATFMRLLNTGTKQTPIMIENDADFRRPTYVFERGDWMSPQQEVTCDVPASMPNFPADLPRTRLGLAQWLVSPANPLTARVAVNRLWEQLFGLGLVETLEDFGTQGAPPSHPELLDWLAVQFRTEYAWSVKRLLREIVTSAAYRQSSELNLEKLARDPRNLLVSRGPRVRLSAEQLRDQALAVSGLLSDKMYGPSVMPYQPPGIWQVIYSDEEWLTSHGEDRYRRGLYTYWRRTSPYPSMLAFDSPSRELCVPRRIPTNTPLQALVTLNDPVYMEAAQGLAERMYLECGENIEMRLRHGHRLALARHPEPRTMRTLLTLYDEAQKYYADDPEAATVFAGGSDEACRTIAALTVVANAIMNLDAFVTKG